LNLRPPAPKAGALPGCATPREIALPSAHRDGIRPARNGLTRWIFESKAMGVPSGRLRVPTTPAASERPDLLDHCEQKCGTQSKQSIPFSASKGSPRKVCRWWRLAPCHLHSSRYDVRHYHGVARLIVAARNVGRRRSTRTPSDWTILSLMSPRPKTWMTDVNTMRGIRQAQSGPHPPVFANSIDTPIRQRLATRILSRLPVGRPSLIPRGG
jgi:hypothetical protein